MKIIISHLKAMLWFAIYLCSQVAVMLLFMIISLFKSQELLNNFINGTDEQVTLATNEILKSTTIPTLLISSIIIILIFIIYLNIKKNKSEVLNSIGYQKIIKYMLIAMIANLSIGIAISFIPESQYTNNLTDSVSLALSGNFVLVLISTGILTPILEEIIFRFGIGNNLLKINKYYALIIQAIIFGIMHGNLIQGTYAFCLGLIFGYVDLKEKSLLPSIIMHITINSSSVISAFLPINESITLLGITTIILILYTVCKNIESKKTI